MQPKRFFAENSQKAFRLVKESIGPKAVILSNRTLPDGVEVIAGDLLSDDEALSMPLEIPTELSEPIAVMPPPDDASVASDSLHKQEMLELRSLITSELAAVRISSWESNDKERFQLFQYLVSLGFSIQLVAHIVSSLDAEAGYEQMRRDALQEIELSINTGTDIGLEVDELSGIVMLHGMSGAGKTTTIAKIAAQVVAAHGPDDVVMLCADNQRLGAHQQLLAYGKILEVPVLPVRRPAELEEILNALKSKRLVLVDQAGISPAELTNIELNPAFNCTIPDIKHYLTLAATTQASTLNRLLAAPWKNLLEGVIVTKLDEAAQLGECISSLIQSHVVAAFASGGHDIQQDLQPLLPDELVNRATALGDATTASVEDSVNSVVKTFLHQQLECLH